MPTPSPSSMELRRESEEYRIGHLLHKRPGSRKPEEEYVTSHLFLPSRLTLCLGCSHGSLVYWKPLNEYHREIVRCEVRAEEHGAHRGRIFEMVFVGEEESGVYGRRVASARATNKSNNTGRSSSNNSSAQSSLSSLSGFTPRPSTRSSPPPLIATASADRTIKVWDCYDRDLKQRCVQTLVGHGGSVTGLTYLNGNLVSCSTDHTVRIWRSVSTERNNLLMYPFFECIQEILAPSAVSYALGQAPSLVQLQDASSPGPPPPSSTGHRKNVAAAGAAAVAAATAAVNAATSFTPSSTGLKGCPSVVSRLVRAEQQLLFVADQQGRVYTFNPPHRSLLEKIGHLFHSSSALAASSSAAPSSSSSSSSSWKNTPMNQVYPEKLRPAAQHSSGDAAMAAADGHSLPLPPPTRYSSSASVSRPTRSMAALRRGSSASAASSSSSLPPLPTPVPAVPHAHAHAPPPPVSFTNFEYIRSHKFHSLGITRIKVVSSEGLVFTLGFDCSVQVRDCTTGNAYFALENPNRCRYTAMEWDARHQELYLGDEKGCIQVWNIFVEKCIFRLQVGNIMAGGGGGNSNSNGSASSALSPIVDLSLHSNSEKLLLVTPLGAVVYTIHRNMSFNEFSGHTAPIVHLMLVQSPSSIVTASLTKGVTSRAGPRLGTEYAWREKLEQVKRNKDKDTKYNILPDTLDGQDTCSRPTTAEALPPNLSLNIMTTDQYLYTSSLDNTIRQWDTGGSAVGAGSASSSSSSSELVCRSIIAERSSDIASMTHLPGSNLIITGHENGMIRMWNIESATFVNLVFHRNTVSSLCVAMTARQSCLLSASFDGSFAIWDVARCARSATSTPEWHARVSEEELLATAFQEKMEVIFVAGNDHLIHMWSLATRAKEGVFRGHQNAVSCIAVDGSFLISGSDDASIMVWSIHFQSALITLPAAPSPSSTSDDLSPVDQQLLQITPYRSDPTIVSTTKGHTCAIRDLIVLREYGLIVTCAFDGKVLVWDYTVGEIVHAFVHDDADEDEEASDAHTHSTRSKSLQQKHQQQKKLQQQQQADSRARRFRCLVFDERSQRIYAGTEENTIMVFVLPRHLLESRKKKYAMNMEDGEEVKRPPVFELPAIVSPCDVKEEESKTADQPVSPLAAGSAISRQGHSHSLTQSISSESDLLRGSMSPIHSPTPPGPRTLMSVHGSSLAGSVAGTPVRSTRNLHLSDLLRSTPTATATKNGATPESKENNESMNNATPTHASTTLSIDPNAVSGNGKGSTHTTPPPPPSQPTHVATLADLDLPVLSPVLSVDGRRGRRRRIRPKTSPASSMSPSTAPSALPSVAPSIAPSAAVSKAASRAVSRRSSMHEQAEMMNEPSGGDEIVDPFLIDYSQVLHQLTQKSYEIQQLLNTPLPAPPPKPTPSEQATNGKGKGKGKFIPFRSRAAGGSGLAAAAALKRDSSSSSSSVTGPASAPSVSVPSRSRSRRASLTAGMRIVTPQASDRLSVASTPAAGYLSPKTPTDNTSTTVAAERQMLQAGARRASQHASLRGGFNVAGVLSSVAAQARSSPSSPRSVSSTSSTYTLTVPNFSPVGVPSIPGSPNATSTAGDASASGSVLNPNLFSPNSKKVVTIALSFAASQISPEADRSPNPLTPTPSPNDRSGHRSQRPSILSQSRRRESGMDEQESKSPVARATSPRELKSDAASPLPPSLNNRTPVSPVAPLKFPPTSQAVVAGDASAPIPDLTASRGMDSKRSSARFSMPSARGRLAFDI